MVFLNPGGESGSLLPPGFAENRGVPKSPFKFFFGTQGDMG